MGYLRGLFCACLFLAGLSNPQATAQATPTIRVTSRLVFLDVTVVDKKGHPVVNGLTKDDFTITEDKKPQPIFSFEAPQEHATTATTETAPLTIFVLDLLNSSFADFAYIRYSVRQYLAPQPALMSAPAEMMVIGNQSLELMQGPTRNKQDLLQALDRLGAVIPYKWERDSFLTERFTQSVNGLQQIALQNQGIPARKNIIWVGHGSPSFNPRAIPEPTLREVQQFMHTTTNMLVDARISLFVIYPGLKIGHFANLSGRSPTPVSAASAQVVSDSDDPFADYINFGVFVNETGGKLFYNHNDIDREIAQSQQLGSSYYTLTYQPKDGNPDGKFRQIRVTLRNPNLHAVTKTGYYAPDKNATIDPHKQINLNIAQAARALIPFDALSVQIAGVVRHPESHTAEITLLLHSKGLDWQASDNGKSAVDITLAAASLSKNQDVLASKTERLILSAPTQDPAHLAQLVTRLHVTVGVPRKTQSIRVVTETSEGGPIGAVDVDWKTINAALSTPSPIPPLVHR